jgi:hypothetical protein
MRTAIVGVVAVAVLVVSAGPSSALSCAEPEPFDLAAAIADADGAAVGTIRAILTKERISEDDATLVLSVDISDVFKGELPHRVFIVRHVSVWGPYYAVGQELALLVAGDEIGDGQQALCGPWYTADDMRGGGEPVPASTGPWGWMGAISDLLRLTRVLAA